MPAETRDHALADPWAFRSIADAVPTTGGGTYAKEALLHLVHPDTFERIFSRGEKWNLAERFSTLVTDPDADVDRRIAQIRARLEERFPEDPELDFYWSIPVMAMWKPEENRWLAFLYWAGRFVAMPDFDATERDFKVTIGGALGLAREAVLTRRADWLELLSAGLRKDNHLIGWRELDRFLTWAAAHPEEALVAVRAAWREGADPVEAVAAFLEHLPKEVIATPGQRVCLASLLLMGVDATRFPPYRPTPLQLAYALTGFGAPETDEPARYRQALAFFDAMLERAPSSDLELRDRLDAQSACWAVSFGDVPAAWPPEDRSALERYRKGGGTIPDDGPDPLDGVVPEAAAVAADADEPVPVDAAGIVPLPTFGALADELLIAEEDLAEIAALLEAKRQIVFYGPPGTGKTFVVRRLAATLAGDAERVRLVQFHPSYAYEDFVEGYRPRLLGSVAGFELVPGPLRKLATAAAADPTHRHVLIIDEMNRGNVAKVFGELYFLLEYRDEPIDLQYSPVRFALPDNLRIIGTMNTADRSIALLDAALRRRFAFMPFFPDREPIAGLLGRWLGRHRPEMAWVAELVDRANAKLADRNGAIGPSFFMRDDLDDARLGLVWDHEIMPYLEDHFFDDPDRLAAFALEKLKVSAAGTAAVLQPADANAAQDEDAAAAP